MSADESRSALIQEGLQADSLILRTLMQSARQRAGLDASRCQFLLEWLRTGEALRKELRKTLAAQGLTELKFSVLVTLFALDTGLSMEADLANHARVTRASITNVLADLQEHHWVTRERNGLDHRVVNVRLTEKGKAIIDAAIEHYLQTAGRLSRLVDSGDQAAASRVCARLMAGAQFNG